MSRRRDIEEEQEDQEEDELEEEEEGEEEPAWLAKLDAKLDKILKGLPEPADPVKALEAKLSRLEDLMDRADLSPAGRSRTPSKKKPKSLKVASPPEPSKSPEVKPKPKLRL